jgi:DNA-binding NtrC family response regulator
MARRRILIVDDEPGMLEVCAETLSKVRDADVVTQSDSEAAAKLLNEEHFDLLIADIRMPRLNGVDLLRIGRQRDPSLVALMLTAYPTVQTAVESIKLGASDYLTKPFLPDDLLATAKRLLEEKRLREENRLLQRQLEEPWRFGDIIGRSQVMQGVFETIRRLAGTDADVLILGETGTGKELVARAIHRAGSRKGGRFVPVDCGAIPEDLLESEFFGHERGAFTGAMTRSLGLLEFANHGTFFLDEVAELPPRLQAKLLRVLQERKIRRVGGTDEIDVDVRVIAATNRNLEHEVAEHRFRKDLYYRINVGRVALPPLGERAEDIPLLVSHLTERYCQEMGREAINFDPDAVEMLQSYAWPGNVRELQNIIKRSLAMARGPSILPEDLPEQIFQNGEPPPKHSQGGFFGMREERLASFEREYLTVVLRNCGGDVSEAAREAKLPRGTVYRLLKKHGLNPTEFRTPR